MKKDNFEEVFKIDKVSLEPLYLQVQRLLEELIYQDYFEGKQKILTEKFLMSKLKVSRNTVRQAVSKLEEKGLVVRERPKGIVLVQNSKKLMDELVSGLSHTEAAIKMGLTPTTKILDFKLADPSEEVISKLNINPNNKVFFCKRLRFHNKIPFFVQYFYLPQEVIPDLKRGDFGERGFDQSLYYIFEKKHGIEILMTVEEIQSISINSKDAELLRIKKGLPVLYIKALIYSIDSRIICYNLVIFSNTYTIRGLVFKRQRLSSKSYPSNI